jgi:hypothetical protein
MSLQGLGEHPGLHELLLDVLAERRARALAAQQDTGHASRRELRESVTAELQHLGVEYQERMLLGNKLLCIDVLVFTPGAQPLQSARTWCFDATAC